MFLLTTLHLPSISILLKVGYLHQAIQLPTLNGDAEQKPSVE